MVYGKSLGVLVTLASVFLAASACKSRTYNSDPSSRSASWPERPWSPGADVSTTFSTLLEDPSTAPEIPKGARVLWVMGLSGKQIEDVSEFTFRRTEQDKALNSAYFEDTLKACRSVEVGWDCEIVPTDTAATVEANASALREVFIAQKLPYFVVAHSRGGVDTIRALTSIEPGESAYLRGVITLQSPHAGIVTSAALRKLSGGLFDFFGRVGELNKELTPDASIQRVGERTQRLAELAARVPILTVGSWFVDDDRIHKGDEPGQVKSILKGLEGVTRGQLKKKYPASADVKAPLTAWRNDGVVALEDTRLPGIRFVDLAKHDHVSPVLTYKGSPPITHAAFLKAIVGTLLAP
jgi:hypothetical protein